MEYTVKLNETNEKHLIRHLQIATSSLNVLNPIWDMIMLDPITIFL